ncbi:hypothetical protein [Mangrovicoccus algicola]|uniref:Uncharacterized protein n=1 Tax=Mangrovicoccus algicola TaxID=2771008 RepID=A0A8J7CJ00_9RHOB|nr:hypothetical protein [Mangrovicoccus algicola]MBE3640215.1 hypothetical protein [Mangrovicoccus algicola]
MDRPRALARLHALAAMRRDADVARLERLRAEIRVLESQIDMLDGASVDRLGAEPTPSAYQMAGRDGLWDMWRTDRVKEIRQRIASLSADRERQGQAARLSVGRHQVLGKLAARHAPGAKPDGS